MKLNGIVSSIIAAGLLFGSAGMAAAATSQDGNPFALYQDWSEPENIPAALSNGDNSLSEVYADPFN